MNKGEKGVSILKGEEPRHLSRSDMKAPFHTSISPNNLSLAAFCEYTVVINTLVLKLIANGLWGIALWWDKSSYHVHGTCICLGHTIALVDRWQEMSAQHESS